MPGVDVEVGVSLDPVRDPARRDVLPCRLLVSAGTVRVVRRSGGCLLEVPAARVRAVGLHGGRPALALLVDDTVLRVDLRLRRAGEERRSRRSRLVRGVAAEVRARARLRAVLRALR